MPGTAESPLLTLIVPIYNGASYVAGNVSAMARTLETVEGGFEILVVCDGSTDGTAGEVERIGDRRVRALHYEPNLGKGHAICFGAVHATGRFVGWLDADLDIAPSAIVNALRQIEHADVDAVIGSKRHRDSEIHYPLRRRFLSWGFQLLVRLLVQVNVRDTQVGAKVFRREMLEVAMPLLLVKRYAFDLELLAVGMQFGFDRIAEIPVRLDYRFTGTGIDSEAVRRMFVDTLAIAYRIHVRHWYVRAYSAAQRERMEESEPLSLSSSRTRPIALSGQS